MTSPANNSQGRLPHRLGDSFLSKDYKARGHLIERASGSVNYNTLQHTGSLYHYYPSDRALQLYWTVATRCHEL